MNASVPVTGIEVCPASKTMNVGETFTLCADVCPQNATNKSVIWCSSDESVATVGAYTGYVMAKKAVSATITATAIDGNGANDTCHLLVKELVTIEKDGNYSKVIFNDGKIWKCNIFYFDTVLVQRTT